MNCFLFHIMIRKVKPINTFLLLVNKIKSHGFFLCFGIILFFISCNNDKNHLPNQKVKISSSDKLKEDFRLYKVPIRFALGFAIDYFKDYKIISLLNPSNRSDTLKKYILSADTASLSPIYSNALHVQIPLKSAVCLSSLYAAYFEKLNLLDKLIGVDDQSYIYSPEIKKKIRLSGIMDVGDISKLNLEKVFVLKPEVLFTYLPAKGSPQYDQILRKNNCILAYTLDQDELTPLGRAEWIIFVSAFFNKEKQASEFIDQLALRYNELKMKLSSTHSFPSVFTGIKYGDIWYMPAGKSYLAQLIKDAGGNYLWNNDTHSGSLNLDFEKVYQTASAADYWINISSFSSLKEVLDADPRYAKFNAFKKKNIFNNIARVNKNGGNDFWESGMLNPDFLLEDLIHIFHPEIITSHPTRFYEKLE